MKRFLLHLVFAFAILLPVLMPSFAQTGTAHSITLTWNADTSATGGFQILRSTTTGGPYTQIATTPAGVDTYVDATGTAGTEYYYVVTGIDTATPPDVSPYSTQVSATALGNPLSPSGLAAVSK